MRSILSPRSVSGVGASRHPLGCLSCKGSMDPKTKIFAQNPRLCIQDRHVNGPPEKRPRLCMQDRHLNGPFGENRAFLCIFCTFQKWVFFHGPDPSYKIDTLTDLPKNVPDSVYKIDTLTDLLKFLRLETR